VARGAGDDDGHLALEIERDRLFRADEGLFVATWVLAQPVKMVGCLGTSRPPSLMWLM